MEIFDSKIEKFNPSSEKWEKETGEWWITLKPTDILSFIAQVTEAMRHGEIIIRIFPDGKGYIR